MGNTLSRHQAASQLVGLAHHATAGHGSVSQPELNRDELIRVLEWMGKYISRKTTRTITIIGVGGAVNVLALRSRDSTHDLDWFSSDLTEKDLKMLRKALAYANENAAANGLQLPSSWFNNQTTLFIPPDIRRRITYEAHEQNYNVFHVGGLRILAAPWQYALVSKLDRIAAGTWKSYDPEDAAMYLRQYLIHKDKERMGADALASLVLMYRGRRLFVKTELHIVNEAYVARYGRDGLEF